MNKHLSAYLSTFQEKKILTTFLAEALFVLLMFALLAGFSAFVNNKAAAFGGLQSAEQLQQLLLTSPEKAQAFLSSLQSFLVLFIVGIIFLIAFGLLSYSLTQAWIWNTLTSQKLPKKKYWKWNGVSIILLIFLLLYLLPAVLLKLLLSWLASRLPWAAVSPFVDVFVIFALIILFYALLFLVEFSFVHSYKVWSSVGDAFHSIKTHWSKFWKMFLLVLGTGIIFNLLLALLPKVIPNLPLTIASAFFFLLFLAWMRVYLVKTMTHEPGLNK